MMKRRELITLLGGAVAWPVATQAQQRPKLPIIGLMAPTTRLGDGQVVAAFVQRLRELGWIEGRTVAIEFRWAEGRTERFAEIAADFVRLPVDILVTQGTESVIAAKRATAVIPIVFAAAGEPVGTRLVTSLARPGGNVTGLSNQQADLGAKRLEMLREVVPALRQLAILANVDNANAMLEIGEAQAAARALGLEAVTFEIRRAEDIAPAFKALRGHAEALYVAAEPLVNANRVLISALALRSRMPTMHGALGWVKAGGLMSYGPNILDQYRRAAEYVDKILRGAKPADLPVMQPTKFMLAVNLKTAKALGIEIPPTLLARADEVIE